MKSESRGLYFKTLENHPRVQNYDNEGMDEGRFMICLIKGFAFDDAAATTEDDPDGNSACHYRSFDTVKEAVADLKWASPCKCGRCVR